jgi:hypothetical protein
MDLSKPGWLVQLESSGGMVNCDLSLVRTGAGASGVIPLLPWDHMQGLINVLELNIGTLQVLNLNGLRIGDVGLTSLVDRILCKDTCAIHTIDLRHNALTASGLRQAITKLSVFNYTLTNWLLEENQPNADFNGSQASSSDSSSSKRPSNRPGPSSTLQIKRDKEKEKDKDASPYGTLNGEPREILTMKFKEIVDKYVAEFLRLNTEAMACAKGEASQIHLKYTLRHPRLCPTRLAKLVSSLQHATSITIEGWIPPPPLTLKSQEKKLSKLSAEQIAYKELKRSVPGTLFASLPKLTELKVIKCARIDVEKAKKGTLRGLLDGVGLTKSHPKSSKEKESGSSSSGGSGGGKEGFSGSSQYSSSSSSSTTASSSNATSSLVTVHTTAPGTGTPIVKSTFIPSIPLEIGAMPSLRRLTLSDCALEEITPEALQYMAHIEQIDFSFNEIAAIPPQISSLSNVTRLFLNSNNITEIPQQLSSMRYLRELWIYDNLISKVPSDLPKWFPVLKDLRILSQRIDDMYMDDTNLLELKRQEQDLINTKSSIGCIGFLGLLKLSQTPEVIIYRTPIPKKKK